MGWDGRLRHYPGYDEAGEKEHGTAVFAAPVSCGKLEMFEEFEAILYGVEGGFGCREGGQVLKALVDVQIESKRRAYSRET